VYWTPNSHMDKDRNQTLAKEVKGKEETKNTVVVT
jgi:hypothetical protein